MPVLPELTLDDTGDTLDDTGRDEPEGIITRFGPTPDTGLTVVDTGADRPARWTPEHRRLASTTGRC